MAQAHKPVRTESQTLHALFALVLGFRVPQAPAYEFRVDSHDARTRKSDSTFDGEGTIIQHVRVDAFGAENDGSQLLVNETICDVVSGFQRSAIVDWNRFGKNRH